MHCRGNSQGKWPQLLTQHKHQAATYVSSLHLLLMPVLLCNMLLQHVMITTLRSNEATAVGAASAD